jgi:hypothetical protein
MLKRHEVQVLVRAGHALEEVRKLARVCEKEARRKSKRDLAGGVGWSRSPSMCSAMPISLPTECDKLWFPRQGKEQDAGPR